MDKVDVLGVLFDPVTLGEAYRRVCSMVESPVGRCHLVVTPNAEIVMAAQKDPELKSILNNADLVVPDGIGVVWAAKHFGRPMPERVSGFDLMEYILRNASGAGHKLFLLGGKPGVAQNAAENIRDKYPNISIVGTHHGYFAAKDEKNIIDEIGRCRPDFLFAGMGAPKQEKWLYAHRNELKTGVAMGVGGSLDVFAGRVKRAPRTYQALGLEWFYRIASEPSRLRRAGALPAFVLKVLSSRK
jgi:N-acetylglucosaminyldiphosphoundecaprenol N-acetyl-beta-D-mannosaminyltransferase